MLPGVSKRVLLVASAAVGLAVVGTALGVILVTGDDSPGEQGTTSSRFATVSRSSDIAILKLATGSVRLLTRRGQEFQAVASPTWAPGGRRVAFARQACPHCPFRIVAAGAAGTTATLSRNPGQDLNEPSWSPGGDRLAVTSSEHAERSLGMLDLASGRIQALELQEEEADEPEEEIESPNHPVFSPDGRTIAFDAESARERTSIQLLDLTTKDVRAIHSVADHYAYPTFSPNGRRLAFSRTDPAYTWDLCFARLDGRDQACLTHGPANDTEPSWSPNGRIIVFASDRDNPSLGLRSLYLVNADGSGLRRLTSGFDDGAPAVSPDGTEVAFVRRGIVRVGQ
jgi:Tol biopolymer transport system component